MWLHLRGRRAASAPFSVVLADWLSTIAAPGVASQSAISRTRSRRAPLIRSQVPSMRQARK